MPLLRSNLNLPRSSQKLGQAVGLVSILLGLSACVPVVAAEPEAIRSQSIEVHYQLSESISGVEVELWYTRDRGATWKKYGIDRDGRSPMVFAAPAEGLYGITLIVRDGQEASAPPPKAFDQPQRWVFVDYTPPLAQWLGVEPGDEFLSRRTVQLRWTAHDDHLENRPVSLSWQSSVDQTWQPIASELANTGRYDWTVPAGVSGQVTLELSVRDRGGHVVERLLGPIPLATWKASVSTSPAGEAESASHPRGPTSAPALAAATRPAEPVDPAIRHKAQERHKLGSWHLLRGQYALAAARFKEALELDPGMLQAGNDLAGTYYYMEDYERAARLYLDVLERQPRDEVALRGAALAYGARKQYAQARDMLNRLLAVNAGDAESLLDLGDVLFRMGDRDGARRNWERAMTVDSSKDEIVRMARKRMELWPANPGNVASVAGSR